MQARKLDTEDAGRYAMAAARDARMKSLAAESTYSEIQKVAATRMKDALGTVYSCDDIYINYRQRWISVKVSGAYAMDIKNLRILEDSWEKQGYTKQVTKQGVIYRIPKI